MDGMEWNGMEGRNGMEGGQKALVDFQIAPAMQIGNGVVSRIYLFFFIY